MGVLALVVVAERLLVLLLWRWLMPPRIDVGRALARLPGRPRPRVRSRCFCGSVHGNERVLRRNCGGVTRDRWPQVLSRELRRVAAWLSKHTRAASGHVGQTQGEVRSAPATVSMADDLPPQAHLLQRARRAGADADEKVRAAAGLSNVLLRGDISIHPDVPEISFSELCARLGEFMLESNVLSESNAELAANQRQNLSDGMALFPKLLRGLDVNVRFTSIDAFEYSEDQVIFDLLNVRLLHGWLADPQDGEPRGAQTTSADREAHRAQLRLSPDAVARPPRRPRRRRRPPPPSRRPATTKEEELRAALALSCELSGASAPPKRRRRARGAGARRSRCARAARDDGARGGSCGGGVAGGSGGGGVARPLAFSRTTASSMHSHTSDRGLYVSSATTASRRSSSTTASSPLRPPRLPLRGHGSGAPRGRRPAALRPT